MIKRRYILWAAVFLAGLFYWLIEGGSVAPPARPPQDLPVSVVTDGVLAEEKDGRKNWLLNVKQIQLDLQTRQSRLAGIDGKLHRPDGGVVDITAQGGRYDQNTGQVVLTGDVDARYSEGWTLRCQEISWTPESDQILASGRVQIAKDGLFASGDMIETDRGLTRIKITGNGTVRKER